MYKSLSLTQKALLAIIVILLPIAVTFWISYGKNKDYVIKNSFKELKFIAEASENSVYLFMEMAKQRAEDFASDGFIRDQLNKIASGNESGINSLNNHLTKNKKPLDDTILGVSLLSLDGKIISSTVPESIGRDVSGEAFFLNGKKSSFATESHHGFIEDNELIISTPVTDKATGKLIGVLANFISLSELSRVLSGDFVRKLGVIPLESIDLDTLKVYMVNKDKLMIAKSGAIEETSMEQLVGTEPVIACHESKYETKKFYKDFRGVKVAGVSVCIPSMGWALLIEEDADEILSSLQEMKNNAIFTMIIVTSLIGILFSLFNQAIVKPIKRISMATNAIALGNYEIRIKPGSGDEIGQLSGAFNDMAFEIKAKTEAFRDSEKKLAEAQRVSNMGSWEWDLIENKISWHFDIYRILGVDLPRFGATFDSLLEYIHPDDRALVEESINRAVRNKENFSVDHRIILPDGVEKIVHKEAKILFDENGRATRMIGMVQDITKRKQAEDELKKSREQLHNLAMYLQNVREDERKRIARDIHDELGQILSVFNLELLWIKKRLNSDQESLINKTEEIMKMADGAIDSVQRISTELRPTLLDDLGLVAGIEWHAQDFERRTGIRCNLAIDVEKTRLDNKLSTALFRIFQEALTNVLRHAGATSLDASMTVADGQLIMEIKDNGKGISDKDVADSNSLGLIGMRERISPWSGEVNISGIAGEGTTVSISVPIDETGEC